jgi:hypothetical protein
VQLLNNARRTYLFVLRLGGLCTGLGRVNLLAEKGESLIVSSVTTKIELLGVGAMSAQALAIGS